MFNSKIFGRILSLLLIGTIAAGIVSCSQDSDIDPDTDSGNGDTDSITSEELKKEVIYSSALETKDFGGKEFNVLGSNSLVGLTLPTTMMFAIDENTGEEVNDVLYARNRFIEENYGVKLNVTLDEEGPIYWSVKNTMLAGDCEYHLLLPSNSLLSEWIQIGGVYPLNYVPGIELDEEYWMPEINEQLKINGNTYYAACAMTPRYYGSIYIMTFNADMANDLKLGDFYELVEDGKWTYDKMFELAASATADTNGDTVINKDDRIGLIYETLTSRALILGAGYMPIENIGGNLKCNLGTEGLASFIQNLNVLLTQDGSLGADDTSENIEYKIWEGTVLFNNPCIFDLGNYRDIKHSFGILPMPKLNEEQEKYIGYSQPWANASPAVPISFIGDDLEMIGLVTNAMAAYGYDYLRPAVYDNFIMMKGARDDKSAAIVDMLFENITFDLTSLIKGSGSAVSKLSSYLNAYEMVKQEPITFYATIQNSLSGEFESYAKTIKEFEDRLK
ncbi:MAG: hypothetical protein HFE63_04470 [Clostridiales bacterium]|nr:hypothetical protein [Clostridiales bacterium]